MSGPNGTNGDGLLGGYGDRLGDGHGDGDGWGYYEGMGYGCGGTDEHHGLPCGDGFGHGDSRNLSFIQSCGKTTRWV